MSRAIFILLFYSSTLTGISIFCLADQKSAWVTRIFGMSSSVSSVHTDISVVSKAVLLVTRVLVHSPYAWIGHMVSLFRLDI